MNARLLLVEDDDAVAAVVRLHLEQAGFSVHRESDGRQALLAARQQRWDLLLLDLTLPGLDGLDLCRQLQQQPADVAGGGARLPIIMISARAGELHRVLGLELGADDYLAKPFSMLELTARVRALLRRTERQRQLDASPQPLQHGPWRLDPLQRTLTQDGRPVALTPREYELLHFLFRHPMQVFSRSQLLEQVWGAGFDGYEHTVNSHINRLRNKLELDAQNPRLVCTVWGVGYRFEPPPEPASPQAPARSRAMGPGTRPQPGSSQPG